MTQLEYIRDGERANATALNKALRGLIESLGIDPDSDKETFLSQLDAVIGSGSANLSIVEDDADRDASFPAPIEGFGVWNSGRGVVERFIGSAWVPESDPIRGSFMARERGLVGDSATDNYAMFQSVVNDMINATEHSANIPKGLRLSRGIYRTFRPITIQGQVGPTIKGEGRQISMVAPGGVEWYGDVFNIVPPRFNVLGDTIWKGATYGPGLVPGSARSIQLDGAFVVGSPLGGSDEFFPLHNSGVVKFFGKRKFTIEFVVQVDEFPGSSGYGVLCCHSVRSPDIDLSTHHPYTFFFFIGDPAFGFDNNRVLSNIGGVSFNLSLGNAPFVIGVPEHIAFDYDYDGDKIARVYRQGVVKDSRACDGSLQHRPIEAIRRTLTNDFPYHVRPRIGQLSKKKIDVASEGFVVGDVFGVDAVITNQEVAFTAGVHDIPLSGSTPREAWFAIWTDAAAVLSITKGADADYNAATFPVSPSGKKAIAVIRIRHNGITPFDATTDDLDAPHLHVRYDTLPELPFDCTLGTNSATVFEGGTGTTTLKGKIDQLRCSNIARYAGVCVPPSAPFAWDDDTDFLWNGNDYDETSAANSLIVARVRGTGEVAGGCKFYIPWKQYGLKGFIGHVHFEDFAISGEQRSGWISASCMAHSSFKKMYFLLNGGAPGFTQHNVCIFNSLEDITFKPQNCRAGDIQSFIAVGLRKNCNYEGGGVLSVFANASARCIEHFLGTSREAKSGLWVLGSDGYNHHFTGLNVDQENLGQDWEYAVYFSNPGMITVNGDIEGVSRPTAGLDLGERDRVIFQGSQLNSPSGNYVLHFTRRPGVPVAIYDTKQRSHSGPPVAWSEPEFIDSYVLIDNGMISRGSTNLGVSVAAVEIDWERNARQSIILGVANTTFTFVNPLPEVPFRLRAKQDVLGGRLITWPAIKWAGGAPPVLTATAGKIDEFEFWHDGVEWFGRVVGLNF